MQLSSGTAAVGVSGCGCSSVGAAVRVGCGVPECSGTAAVGVSGCGCGCSSVGAAVRVGCGVPECGDCEWCRE